MTVDSRRLFQDLADLNRIGKLPGHDGIHRMAYTPAECEARAWVAERMADIGLVVEIDGLGNVFGTPAGLEHGPWVLTGSHLDSVVNAGPLDGSLGVVCALEAVRSLRESGEGMRVGIVAFACEESSRFGVGCIGSQYAVGALDFETLRPLRDAEGISLPEALQAAGLDPRSDSVPRLSPENLSGFLEVHLEQGKELEDAGVPLGIVTHIASPWRWWIRVRGEQGHTGGAAMADRRDALAGAADLVLAAEHIGNLWEPKGVRVTVGVLRAYPGLINSIAGLVELGVDLRGTDTENVVVAKDALFQRVEQIAVRRNLRIESEVITEGRPYAVPPRMVDLARKAALEQGIQAPAMISWSAHDAMHMGRVAPSGLLFVRNKTGVSHHPEERVRPEDLVTGTLILRKLLQKCSESSLTSGSEG